MDGESEDRSQGMSFLRPAVRPARENRNALAYGGEVGEGYGSTFRARARTTPVYTKPENQREFGSGGGGLSYAVGDRVRHIKFGDGEVTAIVSGGRDYEVTVDFDRAGTKKMFASFAKLKKINL